MEIYCDRLARALSVVINIIDPHAIVLGGGLSRMSLLYDRVPELWKQYVFSEPDLIVTRLLPPTLRRFERRARRRLAVAGGLELERATNANLLPALRRSGAFYLREGQAPTAAADRRSDANALHSEGEVADW